MPISALLHGVLIGFLIAIPTGPVGFLCVKRTLVNGFRAGIISSLGSIAADLFYSAIVVFGLKFFSDFLIDHKYPLHILSGLFLIYIGVRGLNKKINEVEKKENKRELIGDFTSTFILTVTNPTLLFTFTILFSTFGLGQIHNNEARLALIAGISVGSLIWWIFFTRLISIIHKKYYELDLQKVNKFSSYFIALVGLTIIATVLFRYPL